MTRENGGTWYADLPDALSTYLVRNGEAWLSRIDPYARAVTSSVAMVWIGVEC
jgi:1,4-alpha-glucan branching enzyme